MFKKFLLTLVVSTGLIGIATPLSAAVFTLRQFNVDDSLTATISNVNFTNHFLLNTTSGENTVDFTGDTANGTNTINFTLTSDHGGWTYGFEIKRDGITIDFGSCGTNSVVGCNNNDASTGTVYTHAFSFDIGATTDPGGDAPEPSTILMTGAGFLGVWGYLKRKSRKSHFLAA